MHIGSSSILHIKIKNIILINCFRIEPIFRTDIYNLIFYMQFYLQILLFTEENKIHKFTFIFQLQYLIIFKPKSYSNHTPYTPHKPLYLLPFSVYSNLFLSTSNHTNYTSIYRSTYRRTMLSSLKHHLSKVNKYQI